MESERVQITILKKISKKLGIKIKLYPYSDFYITLEKGMKKVSIYWYSWSFNSTTSEKTAKDKFLTSILLSENKIPCIKHEYFYNSHDYEKYFPDGVFKSLRKYFLKNNSDLILKNNKGGGGVDIYRVQTQSKLESISSYLLNKYGNFCASKYVEAINEIRFVIYRNEVLLCYKKTKRKNDLQFNLSTGAKAVVIKPSKEMECVALKSAKIVGLDFCSVDILLLKDETFCVLEVNAGVTIEKFALQSEKHFRLTEKLYEKVLSTEFL